MNLKAWITVLLFIVWILFCWKWVQSKKETCCTNQAKGPVASLPAKGIDIPIYYTLNSANPKKGNGFDNYKKTQLSELGPLDTLVIHGWYFNNENNPDSLAKSRAENLKSFFGDIAGNRIKILTERHSGTMDPSSEGFQAASFQVIHKEGSLIKKLNDKILIYFPPNSTEKVLDPEVESYMDSLSQNMKSHPAMKIEVIGYTDSTGEKAQNIQLSKRRANFLKANLFKKGIDTSRIKSDGLGPVNFIANNDSPEGRSKNRRVELTLVNP